MDFGYDANLYDEWYKVAGKDYRAEAKSILYAAEDATGSAVRTLLDVACGTGRHADVIASRGVDVTGIDLNPEFVRLAQSRVPQGTFHEGDMRTFDLDAKFDAVICCFSAIGHVNTHAELDSTIARMADHVRPGGVLIVEPWFAPEQWNDGQSMSLEVKRPGYIASRINVSRSEGDVAIVHFACSEATEIGVRQWEEMHRLLLITPQRYEHAFEQAGLQTSFAPSTLPRGAWIGVKQA